MSLKDKERFAILLQNKFNDEKAICDVVRKVSSRQHVGFNVATLDCKRAYIIYDVDKKYLFNMATNKKLKLIWRDREDFYIIDFSTNTKGNIISHLTFDKTDGETIDGSILFLNIDNKFKELKKIQLISSSVLDKNEPYKYEDFCIYKLMKLYHTYLVN